MFYTHVGLEDKKILIAHLSEGADCMLQFGDGKVIFRLGNRPGFGENRNPTETWRKRYLVDAVYVFPRLQICRGSEATGIKLYLE